MIDAMICLGGVLSVILLLCYMWWMIKQWKQTLIFALLCFGVLCVSMFIVYMSGGFAR